MPELFKKAVRKIKNLIKKIKHEKMTKKNLPGFSSIFLLHSPVLASENKGRQRLDYNHSVQQIWPGVPISISATGSPNKQLLVSRPLFI